MIDDVKMEKVAYDTDIFARVKDIFQKRKKREIETFDVDDNERVSFFNGIKDSTGGKCKASNAKRENEVIKKRRKRSVLATSRSKFSSEFVREKRLAEQKLLELQHKFVRCNKDSGPGAKECMSIYQKFQTLVKEVNEKFHRFDYENFEGNPNPESDIKMKTKEQENLKQKNVVKPPNDVNLQKNNENVGQSYFGDGFYSYSYDKIPRFHEELDGNFDNQQRNLKSMSRNEFQNQGQAISTNKGNQAKVIPVKLPESTGENLIDTMKR